MSEFRIGWTTETWHETVIQARSVEEARAKFWENPANWVNPNTVAESGLLQDTVEIEEVVV